MPEITGHETPRRIEVAGKVAPFDARLSYELASTASGTRLTNTAELEPPLPLGFVGDVYGGWITASVAENFGVLDARPARPRASRARQRVSSRTASNAAVNGSAAIPVTTSTAAEASAVQAAARPSTGIGARRSPK